MDAKELIEQMDEGELVFVEDLGDEQGNDWQIEIGFDDFVAHVLEDEVEKFVEWLPTTAGIDRVIHPDRGQVGVYTALSESEIESRSYTWWRERLTALGAIPDSGGV